MKKYAIIILAFFVSINTVISRTPHVKVTEINAAVILGGIVNVRSAPRASARIITTVKETNLLRLFDL